MLCFVFAFLPPFMYMNSIVKHLLTTLNSQLSPDDVYLLSRSFPGRMCIMRPCRTESKVSERLFTVTTNLSNPLILYSLAKSVSTVTTNLSNPLILYSLARSVSTVTTNLLNPLIRYSLLFTGIRHLPHVLTVAPTKVCLLCATPAGMDLYIQGHAPRLLLSAVPWISEDRLFQTWQHTWELISAWKMSYRHTQQQRPESPMEIITSHVSKHKVYKLHHLKRMPCSVIKTFHVYMYTHARWELP